MPRSLRISMFPRMSLAVIALLCVAMPALARQGAQQTAPTPASSEGDYVVHDFHFKSGETMAELRLHYTTLGKPARDANGHTTNAVLIMHGTGGSGDGFLSPIFAGVLFGPGQLLDASKYFIILPDAIGHGKSSKPSDGLHANFPHYDYEDMVAAQHELVQKGLGLDHLRLVMGTSMGCMHSFVWAETYPSYMDALFPLACNTIQVAGRNRLWRDMVIDAIRNDPEWKNGEYTSQPRTAVEVAADVQLIAGSAPIQMQKSFPTRDEADKYLADYQKSYAGTFDANNFLYAVSASRNYDPSPKLDTITVPVIWINSGDDFINPPELGIAEQQSKRLKNGRFVLIPASDQTHGHGTHTYAAVWQQYLKELLDKSAR
jgi:homoserine O-acetyltransferase/O-succinyltransferase